MSDRFAAIADAITFLRDARNLLDRYYSNSISASAHECPNGVKFDDADLEQERTRFNHQLRQRRESLRAAGQQSSCERVALIAQGENARARRENEPRPCPLLPARLKTIENEIESLIEAIGTDQAPTWKAFASSAHCTQLGYVLDRVKDALWRLNALCDYVGCEIPTDPTAGAARRASGAGRSVAGEATKRQKVGRKKRTGDRAEAGAEILRLYFAGWTEKQIEDGLATVQTPRGESLKAVVDRIRRADHQRLLKQDPLAKTPTRMRVIERYTKKNRKNARPKPGGR